MCERQEFFCTAYTPRFFFKNNFSMGSVEEYAFCIEVARKLDLKLFKLFDSGIFIAGT